MKGTRGRKRIKVFRFRKLFTTSFLLCCCADRIDKWKLGWLISRSFISLRTSRLIYIFFFSILFSQFSLVPKRMDEFFGSFHRFGIKLTRFVVERVGRIIELNEEANVFVPFLFSKRDETLRQNFTFRRGMKVNWRNWCHAAVAILTLYGREGEKYWRSKRSSGPCPVENKHHPAAAIPRYLIVSASVWSVSRRHGLSLLLVFPTNTFDSSNWTAKRFNRVGYRMEKPAVLEEKGKLKSRYEGGEYVCVCVCALGPFSTSVGHWRGESLLLECGYNSAEWRGRN